MDRLRLFTRLEGDLLFREFRQRHAGGHRSLPALSVALSKTILQLKDALLASGRLDVYILPLNQSSMERFYIESPGGGKEDGMWLQIARQHGFMYTLEHHQLCRALITEYVPPALRAIAIGRIDTVLPELYRKRVLATAIACKVVYHEGLSNIERVFGVNNVGPQQVQAMADWALRYLVELDRVAQLVQRVDESDGLERDVKDRLIYLLEYAGARIGTEQQQ
jgi:hypothetical protein